MKSTSKTNITLGVRSRMSNIRLSWEKCMSKCRLMFKLKYYQMSRWYPAANEHYLWFVWYRLKWYIDFTRFFIRSFAHPYKVICATERCSNLLHRETERERDENEYQWSWPSSFIEFVCIFLWRWESEPVLHEQLFILKIAKEKDGKILLKIQFNYNWFNEEELN